MFDAVKRAPLCPVLPSPFLPPRGFGATAIGCAIWRPAWTNCKRSANCRNSGDGPISPAGGGGTRAAPVAAPKGGWSGIL